MRPRIIRTDDKKLTRTARISKDTAWRLKSTKRLLKDLGFKLSNADDLINLGLDNITINKIAKDPIFVCK